MLKFGRNYRLTVNGYSGDDPRDVIIEYPLTVSFSIRREVGNSLNTLSCQITNLSEETRNSIFQDRFSFFKNASGSLENRKVTLEAGYGNNLFTVFKGNLFEAGSFRQGNDVITYIEGVDGIFDTTVTQTYATIQKGAQLGEILNGLVGEFPNLYFGASDSTEYKDLKIKRPLAMEGNTWKLLQLYAGNQIFIDQEVVYLIGDATTITYKGETPIIDASTGLLSTPRREEANMVVEMLFEPSIHVGQVIEVASSVSKIYNGKYKVLGVQHNCVMSGAIGGECRTTLTLLIDGVLFKPFRSVTPQITRANLELPPNLKVTS